MPVRKQCGNCGSTEISYDSYTEWDEDIQEFVTLSVMDSGHVCRNCEAQDDIVEVEYGFPVGTLVVMSDQAKKIYNSILLTLTTLWRR